MQKKALTGSRLLINMSCENICVPINMITMRHSTGSLA